MLTRRQFTIACGANVLAASNTFANLPTPSGILLPSGATMPALGMGTWRLAQGRRPDEQEEQALKTGIDLGMTLIDTAEMYGSGTAEELVGRVIQEQRDKVTIVSKVLPSNAGSAERIRRACANSLERMGIDKIDLYLLHWRGGIRNLKIVVDTFEDLKAQGFIGEWGVSNFTVRDMEELFSIENGDNCATNQVEYSLVDRGVERDLIPWCHRHNMPIMAYSPLGSGNNNLLNNSQLQAIAQKYQVSPAAVAIAWTLRNGQTMSIPATGSAIHMRENAAALSLRLEQHDIDALNRAFPV